MEVKSNPPPNICYNVTAVVLSGGSSNNFSPITENLPKTLLKVNGKTLLYHILHNLTTSGFKDVLVVTNKDYFTLIRDNINSTLNLLRDDFEESFNLPNVTTYEMSLSEDGSTGTTEVLNNISKFINNDFVVLPCDIYGHFDFKIFLNEHFKNSRLCTVALLNKQTESSKNKKDVCLGGNEFEDWSFKYRVITTLDEETNSLLGISQLLSIENCETHDIYKWLLPDHPKCVINKDLLDIHVYAFSKHIFEVLKCDLPNNSSIRLDLIPYLVKIQTTPFLKDCLNVNKVYSECNGTKKILKSDRWSYNESFNELGVFYYIGSGEGFKCCRVNSIDSLYSVNIQSCFSNKNKPAKKNPKHKNVVLGLNTNLSESSEIKNSVIGNNVYIGNNVKITDSMVMDNCTIEDNNVLTKTILGNSVFMEEKSNLKNTIVRSGTRVPVNTHLEKDYLPSFM